MEELNVPYIVYESSVSRMERALKRMFIALIVSIIVTLASNVAWIWLWNQYDYVSDEVDIENDDGNANYIGNDGDIYNGFDSRSITEEDSHE